MAKLNKTRCAVIAGAMLIAAALAVDYAGVFVLYHSDIVGVTGFSFKCVDKVTGSPTAGVQLACFLEGKQIPTAPWPKGTSAPASVGGFIIIMHTGTEGSTRDGTIGGAFHYDGSTTRTVFFILDDYGAGEKRKKSVEFVFSHPSYRKESRTHVVGRLKGDIVIRLDPVEPGETP